MHVYRLLSILASLVIALANAPASAASSYEYGETAEMRGLTKVYVDTGSEVDLQKVIRSVLVKRLTEISIVRETDCELALVLTYEVRRNSHGKLFYDGVLHAVRPMPDGSLRLLATYRHDEEELDDLADEIVKKFIKEYKRVNSR